MTTNTNAAQVAKNLIAVAEDQAFEAWYKQDCLVGGVNARIAARAAWNARAALTTAAPQPCDIIADAVRVPLDSLHADAEWLCARLLDKSLTREEVVTAIRSRIDAAKAALTTAAAVPPEGGVMVPVELANRVQESLGEFLMDHGWSQRDMDTSDDFGAVLLAAAPKAEPVPAGEREELREGASYESMNLAAMVLSDCGHSSNYQPLLERVAGRIDRHVERLLTAQREDLTTRAQAAPAAATHIQQPYSLAEIKAKIASNDYNAELMLQHAMLLLEKPAAVAGPAEAVERIVHLSADRTKRIYIAGPMTGLPNYNFPLFDSTATELRAAGWHVENPAEHGHVEGAGWADYLRWDISRIVTCGAIYLLPGWERSKGARLEVSIAEALGMAVMRSDGAAAPQPAVQQGGWPTMDDAIAAGDGTLHGAIDHWQRRALDAERVLLSRGLVLEEAAKACEERERRANREDVRATCRLCAKDIRSLAVVNQSLTTGPTAHPAAPVAQGDARVQGLIAAADYIDGLASGYAAEHSYTEPDTGAVVFDRRDAGLEYHSTLVELADDLRGMAARAPAQQGGA